MILINNRQRKITVNIPYLTQVTHAMLATLGYKDFDIGILLTTNASIRHYNKTYRNKDAATDILSFPFHADVKAGNAIVVREEDDKNLGDIIISLEYVQKKATEYNTPFQEHLIMLLAHGIAHLLNYDHITDEDFAKMQKVEANLLQAAKRVKK